MHPLLQQDVQSFVNHYLHGNALAGSTFLITGATGLIGSVLVHCLLALDQNICIIAPVRNRSKAISMFDPAELDQIDIIDCDVCNFDYSSIGPVDYIIHCAAPTSSRFFVECPVETATFIYNSTDALLRFAHQYPIKSFVFISSLEVYGQIIEDKTHVDEDTYGYLDPLNPRSSYPLAKLAAENLCSLYAHQYGVPARIARLTQTTGVGVPFDDNRVINQFARKAAMCEDIFIHSQGNSARPYCYTIDAIDAILTILLKGQNAETYNVSNDATYISVYEMAEYLQKSFSPSIQIRRELGINHGYAPETRLRLTSSKLSHLGWYPRYDLRSLFDHLIPWLRRM